ncbi:MAG: DNA-binding protein [archaeon]|nr:DNA-binding protein [archaeon]
MTELDDARQKKMEELRQKQAAEAETEQKLDVLVKRLLTEEARARLSNVKLVNKEIYFKAVQTIIYLFNAGQVKGKIDEAQLKELLKKLAEKKEINIKRK